MKVKVQLRNGEELTKRIAELEARASHQKIELQETFGEVTESLKPMNLMKSGFRSVFTSEHKGDILNAVIGLGSGFISRKLLLGKSTGFVGKTVGKAIQWGMAGIVSKNADKIKEKAGQIIDKILKKKQHPVSAIKVILPAPKRTVR